MSPYPKDVRQWSADIRQIAIETQVAVTQAQWDGGFAQELADWVMFCERNGGGARLKFAQREQQRLEKKYGKVEQPA